MLHPAPDRVARDGVPGDGGRRVDAARWPGLSIGRTSWTMTAFAQHHETPGWMGTNMEKRAMATWVIVLVLVGGAVYVLTCSRQKSSATTTPTAAAASAQPAGGQQGDLVKQLKALLFADQSLKD